MKKEKVRTFKSRLSEDLKDPEFKVLYQEERQALMLAIKIASSREKGSVAIAIYCYPESRSPQGNL